MTRLLIVVVVLAIGFAGLGKMLGDKFDAEQPVPVPNAASISPPAAAASGPRVVALRGDARGHFRTDVTINGRFVRALVDTGASIVALSAEDAEAAGIRPGARDWTSPMQTANGVVKAARVRISELRLQSIVLRDVEAAVLPAGALRGTLLGMSVLKRLTSFEMNGGTLVLKQ